MNTFGQQVARWTPVIIRHLPQIIKIGADMYALWCSIRGTKAQNDAVVKAMRLINQYQHKDDIDRLLEDPKEKRELLEGLTILMNRINEHERKENGLNGGTSSFSSHSKHSSEKGNHGPSFASPTPPPSQPKPKDKTRSWQKCEVCLDVYNLTDRRPTLLQCGHTFCRECLGNEVVYRRSLRCPKCKASESRSLADLALNYALMEELYDIEQAEAEADDTCCGKTCGDSNGDSCEELYEKQLQYAIHLSEEEAEIHGSSYVEELWLEVMESEDVMLARALQDSEVFEASRLCFERHGSNGGSECADIMKEHDDNDDDCAKGKDSDDDDDDDDVCGKKNHDNNDESDDDDDCKKGKKECDERFRALLEEEEERIIQMVLMASLEEQ